MLGHCHFPIAELPEIDIYVRPMPLHAHDLEVAPESARMNAAEREAVSKACAPQHPHTREQNPCAQQRSSHTSCSPGCNLCLVQTLHSATQPPTYSPSHLPQRERARERGRKVGRDGGIICQQGRCTDTDTCHDGFLPIGEQLIHLLRRIPRGGEGVGPQALHARARNAAACAPDTAAEAHR